MLLTVYIRSILHIHIRICWVCACDGLGWTDISISVHRLECLSISVHPCFFMLCSHCSLVDVWCVCLNRGLYVQWSILNCYKEPPIFVGQSWKCIYTGNVPTPFSPIRSPLSLMVVWSSSHWVVVFMSAPGTFQPSSCTWCLWKVYTSHRTCPVDSPSTLLMNTNNSSIHIVWCAHNLLWWYSTRTNAGSNGKTSGGCTTTTEMSALGFYATSPYIHSQLSITVTIESQHKAFDLTDCHLMHHCSQSICRLL